MRNKMSVKINIIFFAFLLVFNSLSAQDEKATLQDTPILIDGISTDWPNYLRFFFSDAKLHFEYRNDDKNLYAIISTSEKSTKIQLIKAGFSVTVKASNSFISKGVLIFWPHPIGMIGVELNNSGQLPTKLVQKSAYSPQLMNDTVTFEGFKTDDGMVTQDCKDEQKIRFARSKEIRSQLVYEISIPLAELFGKSYDLNKISTIPFQFQININGLSQNRTEGPSGRGNRSAHEGAGRDGMSSGMGAGMGRRGGMSGGGGMPGGMGGGMSNGMRSGGDEMPNSDDMPDRPEMNREYPQLNMSFEKKNVINEFYFSKGAN